MIVVPSPGVRGRGTETVRGLDDLDLSDVVGIWVEHGYIWRDVSAIEG